jgi:hypothetical protein
MKFVQVQEIEFTLRIFSQNLWLANESLSKQKMTFKNTVNFLGEEWTAELRKENELFLFAKKDGDSYRIRLYCEEGNNFGKDEFLSGELRKNIGNDIYELESILKIESIKKRNINGVPSWGIENLKQVYNEKKNFSSWSADEVYYWAINILNIDKNEAYILKDEDVDGLVLSNLNDPEMKGLNQGS